MTGLALIYLALFFKKNISVQPCTPRDHFLRSVVPLLSSSRSSRPYADAAAWLAPPAGSASVQIKPPSSQIGS